MHLRIVGILRLCHGKLTPIVRHIGRGVMLIQRGILVVGLDIDLVISNDFLNSKVVIIHAMIEMMFVYLYDFDIVDNFIANFEVFQVTLATTSNHTNDHDNDNDANNWGDYCCNNDTRRGSAHIVVSTVVIVIVIKTSVIIAVSTSDDHSRTRWCCICIGIRRSAD